MTGLPGADVGLVIFDCDGVLIDSELISARILIELLAGIGVAIDAAYVRENFLGRSFTKVAAEIRQSFGHSLAPDFEQRYRSQLAAAFATELRPVAGIEAVLDNIGVAYCMATSSSPERARMSLDLGGLAHFFGDRVFTASQVAKGKPAPDLFLFAARSMGVAPARCLVIEDSTPGIVAATAAGMQVLRFVGASHMRFSRHKKQSEAPGVAELAGWPEFFAIAPHLRRANQTRGETDVR